MNTYIATFYAHFGAVRFSRTLKQQGISAKIMPVPRNLSSSCGSCVSFAWNGWDVTDFHNEIEQIVLVTEQGYEQVYCAENS